MNLPVFASVYYSREHYCYAASAAGRKGRGPLEGQGASRGGKKEKKRKKMMKGRERSTEYRELWSLSFFIFSLLLLVGIGDLYCSVSFLRFFRLVKKKVLFLCTEGNYLGPPPCNCPL